ncbi:hypothetical protein BRARA_I04274, partial [Brassica rapa]
SWILWSLWLVRNNRIFNNKDTTYEEVITKATAAAHEWLREQSTIPKPKVTVPTPSHHGPTSYTSINSYAAWRSDMHLAGLGWTIKEGNLTSSFLSHCYFVNSPLVAEGLALREALTCCIAKGIRAMHCNSDSLQIIRAINEEAPMPEIYGIVSDILNLVFAFDFITFVWIQRSNDKAVDILAKQALLNAPFVSPPMNPGG